MFPRLLRCLLWTCVAIFALLVSGAWAAWAELPAAASSQAPTMVVEGLGKGAVPLDGRWQFHLGDDLAWAQPNVDDATGHNEWEALTADAPWGAQGHPAYQGFGWYRKHLSLTPAPGASPDFSMIIPNPGIDDVYELYWNGILVAHSGSMPPNMHWIQGAPPHTHGLGPIRNGVLAVRVFKTPLASNDDGTAGGFEAVPIIGSPQAILELARAGGYLFLQRSQFTFGLTSLYTLVALLSFLGWLRDRKQWLLFWMSIYALSPGIELVLQGLGIAYDAVWLTWLVQTTIQIREASQWFVLLYLLQLDEYPYIVRLIRIVACVTTIVGSIDGILLAFYPSLISAVQMQTTDAVLTALILPQESLPAFMVAYAIFRRQKLDPARWIVASFAFLGATWYAVSNISAQGIRFTHWQLSNVMAKPVFAIFHNPFSVQLILRTLLFLSFVYAVFRYANENRKRQAAMEQEFQNAREVQQVLVPETLPIVPGFSVTSAYRPAQEVGGDFFQIIPLEKGSLGHGSTLILIGDVSGKGLKAAMAVSMIVGAARMIVEYTVSPAEILSALNRRLAGRMQGGFATCLALRLNRDGSCVVSSAGHPAPYLNQHEIRLPGALPLGLSSTAAYEESTIRFGVGDHCAMYTDGLLEARSNSGELYGFERLEMLFATKPNAMQASDAAVDFGQDDDITVLTLIRMESGEEATSTHSIPKFVRA
jgi:Stage II sporulation protein E (SpoIIE)